MTEVRTESKKLFALYELYVFFECNSNLLLNNGTFRTAKIGIKYRLNERL